MSPQSIKTINGSNLARTIKSASMLTNSIRILDVFEKLNHQFDQMYAKRAFVCHFMGEMEEGDFSEGREGTAALVKDYENDDGIADYYEGWEDRAP